MSLVLVVTQASHTVMLLGDVDQLEEEREGGEHRPLRGHVQTGNRAFEPRAVAAATSVARQRAYPLLERQERLPLLLHEHPSEEVTEQTHVGAQALVAARRRPDSLCGVDLS